MYSMEGVVSGYHGYDPHLSSSLCFPSRGGQQPLDGITAYSEWVGCDG